MNCYICVHVDFNITGYCFRTKTSVLQRKDFSQLLKNVGGNLSSLKQELTDYNTFTVAVPDNEIKPQCFR